MKLEVINSIESDAGGFTQIEFMLKGEKVYSNLNMKVVGIAFKESQELSLKGRVHTSTANGFSYARGRRSRYRY